MYIGLKNADAATVIDTATNTVIATIPVGQASQGVAYIPDAVRSGDGTQNLQPLGVAGNGVHLALASADGKAATTVALFDQGLVQMLQAGVTGLTPNQPYVLALAADPTGSGTLEPLADFMTNPAGAAIVSSVGPIRQVIQGDGSAPRRYLVIVAGTPAQLGAPVQVQLR
jgi:YVTN family beta-propeller protein